jgi:hypothetical protein
MEDVNMLNIAGKIGPIFKKLPWDKIIDAISRLPMPSFGSEKREKIKYLNDQTIQITEHINQITERFNKVTEQQTRLVDNVKILSSRLILLFWLSSAGFIISIIALILAIMKR